MSKVGNIQRHMNNMHEDGRTARNKTQKTLQRNMLFFMGSLMISWLPLVLWNCVGPVLRYFNASVDPRVCQAGSKIASISPWLRLVISSLAWIINEMNGIFIVMIIIIVLC